MTSAHCIIENEQTTRNSNVSPLYADRCVSTPQLERPRYVEDMALADRVRAGDQLAFSYLYERYHRNVRYFILKRIDNRSDAEDLTQETFVQAFLSISRFEGRSRLLTWLIGIARFTCMRFYRSTSRWMTGTHASTMSQEVAIDARIEECIEALIALDRCEELVGRLRSEDDQAIFRLHYYDCKTIVEIANELGKTVDATKTSLWRSRRALKNHVSDYDVLTE